MPVASLPSGEQAQSLPSKASWEKLGNNMGTVRRCARYRERREGQPAVQWKVCDCLPRRRHEWALENRPEAQEGAAKEKASVGGRSRRDAWFLGSAGKERLPILALIALFP